MKNTLSHPIMQIFSFCVVLINGKEWGPMPYGWYVVFGSADLQLFAITGAVAIIVALLSIFRRRDQLQLVSLFGMWVSLLLFFWQLSDQYRPAAFKGGPALITALLFITVSVMICKDRFTWKNS